MTTVKGRLEITVHVSRGMTAEETRKEMVIAIAGFRDFVAQGGLEAAFAEQCRPENTPCPALKPDDAFTAVFPFGGSISPPGAS